MKVLTVSILGVLAVAGCADRPLEDTGATESTSSPGSSGEMTTGQPTPTTVTSTTVTPTTVTSTTGLPEPTTGPFEPTATGSAVTTASPATSATDGDPSDTESGKKDCNAWQVPAQDCAEGEKCTIDGGLSQTQCVDVSPDPKDMYEPCQILMGDAFSGHDDCGPGLLCWDVDPATGIGHCIGFCQDQPGLPTCVDPTASCQQCQECVVGLCLPGCDPLGQDCPSGDMCVPDPQDNTKFICVLDASGPEGQAFDPCAFVNACDPGNLCVGSELAAECDQAEASCCLPLCDLEAPNCPGAGQACLPWFEPGMAPAELEHVGLCGLP